MSSINSENSLEDQTPLSSNTQRSNEIETRKFEHTVVINPKRPSKLDNNKTIRVFSGKTQLFISFFEQGRYPAFVFFLIVMVLEMVPLISLSDGYPITGLPLLLVFFIQMLYEFFQGRLIESISRPHNEAKIVRINEKSYNQQFGTPSACNLHPGDIIKLEYLTEVPVDCLLIQTSLSDQNIDHCYVSTSNIDGREELIQKTVVSSIVTNDIYTFVKDYSGQKLLCTNPNRNIYDWNGVLHLNKLKTQVNMDNLILAGSFIRSSMDVYALVVNTGANCKSWIDRPIVRSKVSEIHREGISLQTKSIYFVLILSALATVLNLVLVLAFKSKIDGWFRYSEENMFEYVFKTYLQWLISLSRLVPLNLMTALCLSDYYQSKAVRREMRKIRIQGFSKKSYPRRIPKNLILNSKVLSDLGRVRRIVTEVEGVLTQSKMLVERIRCGGKLFDEAYEEERELEIQKCEKLVSAMSERTPLGAQVRGVLRCMAVCNNTGFVKPSLGSYAHSSPIESALCRYARKYGAVLMDHQFKMKTKYVSENFGGMDENNDLTTQREYHILCNFDHQPEKQRDSVLLFVRNEEGKDKVVLYMKGTEKGMERTLSSNSESDLKNNLEQTGRDLTDGRDCYFFAKREMNVAVLISILKKVNSHSQIAQYGRYEENMKNDALQNVLRTFPKDKLDQLRNELEKEMKFLGSASLKNMLEYHLPETFSYFRDVGIVPWLVSSSSVYKCSSVAMRLSNMSAEKSQSTMVTMYKDGDITAHALSQMRNKVCKEERSNPFTLGISSRCLEKILEYQETSEQAYSDFTDILDRSTLCVFGGLNPVQKRLIIQLSKSQFPDDRVMAVGSNAGDELMMSEADIGLSLFNGTKYLACKSCDIYLQKFNQLRLLLFSAGSEAQRKDGKVFLLCWFSSFVLGMPEFWAGGLAYFAPQRVASQWISSTVGIVLPLLSISIYAASDRIWSAAALLNLADFFKISLSGRKRVLIEILLATVFSLVITLFALSMFDSGTMGGGFFYGWFTFGHITLLSCLFMIYMRIAAYSNTFSFGFVSSLLCGGWVFLILWIAESSISGSNVYQTFFEIFEKPQIYVYFTGMLGLGLVQYLWVKMEFYGPVGEISDSGAENEKFKKVDSRSDSGLGGGSDSGREIRDSLMGGSSSSGR